MNDSDRSGSQEHRPLFELRLGSFDIKFLRFLDERIHNVGLPACRQFPTQEINDGWQALDLTHSGDNAPPPERTVLQNRNIQIAVERLGDRSRDGCRRHHKHIGGIRPLDQLGALQHAEFVLLIDHNEAQLLKLRALEEKGVRADDQRGTTWVRFK